MYKTFFIILTVCVYGNAYMNVDLTESLCHLKVSQISGMTGSDHTLDPEESVCSLTAEEFSDITGFAYDASLMESCFWALQHDIERSTLRSVDRYRVYRPVCLIPGGEIMINGYLSIYADFSYRPTVSVYYEIYTHNDGEYVHKVHSRSHSAPYPSGDSSEDLLHLGPISSLSNTQEIISYSSPVDDWKFDYQITPSKRSYTFSFQEDFNGELDIFISKTLNAGTIKTIKHKQSPWYHWQYI
jgi:hypothetical protein